MLWAACACAAEQTGLIAEHVVGVAVVVETTEALGLRLERVHALEQHRKTQRPYTRGAAGLQTNASAWHVAQVPARFRKKERLSGLS